MSNRFSSRQARALVSALGLSASVIFGGCDGGGDDTAVAACGADLARDIDAFVNASAALEAHASALQGDVLGACTDILVDLGAAVPAEDPDPNKNVELVCAAAQAAIAAELGGATLSVAIAPPSCTVDAEAQFECESSCYVDASCEPGSIESRCEPGDLSVVCDGTCEVNAYCVATADAAVNCNGVCEGVCEGTCEGTFNEAGECAGTCVGTCSGSCQITGDAGIDCGADARCRGGCDVQGTAPQCHAELTPPQCAVDAECQAACEGQASFNAQCTEGKVVVVADGNPELVATLEANLPTLLAVTESLDLVIGETQTLIAAGSDVALAIQSLPGCAAIQAARIAAAIEAATTAATSLEVSVQVSVSVSGCASTGDAC